MKIVLYGFKTKDDVRKILKLYEKKGWTWLTGEKPLEYNDREEDFEENQNEQGGFTIDYKDNFLYADKNFSIKKGYTLKHFTEVIQEFIRGELVEVSNDGKQWDKRIYLTTIEGSELPVIVVNSRYEEEFDEGKPFHIDSYIYIRKLKSSKMIEVSIDEVAEKFNTTVDKIRIKK